MSTKPFEPKLPLPEAFETELMKNGIEQLQPLVNQYLQVRPIIDKQTIGSLIHLSFSSFVRRSRSTFRRTSRRSRHPRSSTCGTRATGPASWRYSATARARRGRTPPSSGAATPARTSATADKSESTRCGLPQASNGELIQQTWIRTQAHTCMSNVGPGQKLNLQGG